MDKLNELTKRIMRNRSANKSPDNQYDCPRCKDTGWLYRQDKNGYEYAYRCDCFAIRQAKELIRNSGISAEFQSKTFDNFSTGNNAQLSNAKDRAMQFVTNFEQTEHHRHNSIMFCGQVGAGKTHLGTAICGELMNRGIAVNYMPYRNALTKLKQNIIDENGYNRELTKYTAARVLYIDDLLKGRLTESDVNIMYEIVNYRYMNNMPIIISTEKEPNDLLVFDEAIGSRIIEMCRGNIIQFRGKELNYRLNF
ncbi:MAG: ATP-binding protein [Lachnospiraceae bacterium]|nr:ATP-binding protein [Lachnospiraceae bacterium]